MSILNPQPSKSSNSCLRQLTYFGLLTLAWGILSGCKSVAIPDSTASQIPATTVEDSAVPLVTSSPAPVQLAPTIIHEQIYGIISSISWAPDSSNIASNGYASQLTITDITTGEDMTIVLPYEKSCAVAWSPNGRWIASGSCRDGQVDLWDVETSQLLSLPSSHTESINSIAWSPDSNTLAVTSGDTTVSVWDVQNAQQTYRLERHHAQVWGVSWSPDGTMLATGDDIGIIAIWNTATGELIYTLEASAPVQSVSWSPTGSQLAVATGDGLVIIWDTERWERQYVIGGTSRAIWTLAWSPDGSMLAGVLNTDTVAVWETETGSQVITLPWIYDGTTVQAVAWSPNGNWFVGGDYYGSMLFWRVEE